MKLDKCEKCGSTEVKFDSPQVFCERCWLYWFLIEDDPDMEKLSKEEQDKIIEEYLLVERS